MSYSVKLTVVLCKLNNKNVPCTLVSRPKFPHKSSRVFSKLTQCTTTGIARCIYKLRLSSCKGNVIHFNSSNYKKAYLYISKTLCTEMFWSIKLSLRKQVRSEGERNRYYSVCEVCY